MPFCNQAHGSAHYGSRIARRAERHGSSDADPFDFTPITRIASRTTNCPTSLVSLVEASRRILIGRDERIGIDAAFCRCVVADRAPVTVPNALTDPRFRDNVLVLAFPGIRFYVGVPVFDRYDAVAAVLCVIDYEPRDGLTCEQLEILVELSRLAADRLRLAEEMGGFRAGELAQEARGEALLVVDGDAAIVHWNSAAERLLAAYADDLFRAVAHRHLPGWDELVADTALAAERASAGSPREVSLVRADGTETVAVASVTREGDHRGTRFRVLLSGSRSPELAVQR